MEKTRIRRPVVWLLALVAIALAYHAWSLSGRGGYSGKPVLNIKHELCFGSDHGQGNVLAIQPWMQNEDYSCAKAFAAKIDGYFGAAQRRGWLRRNTVVVLPEYLGAWLLCAGEKQSMWQATSVDAAMKWKVLANAPAFAWRAASAPCADRAKYAVFRTSAERMASIYHATLSQLARDYHVTIVGGSIILPSPSVVNGELRAGEGALYNVSPVYGPDGRLLDPLVKKVYLTEDEKGFVSPGSVADLPVYQTPAGRLAVLICADAWFPESYNVLRHKQAQIVVVPSYILGERSLRNTWAGYSGQPTPADVPQAVVGKISRHEAWRRYAFAGRFGASGARCGAMACLSGNLWDMGSDPLVVSARKSRSTIHHYVNCAVLANTWIEP